MNKYIQYVREVFFILGESRKRFPFLVALFICSSLMDLIGIGFVAPYINLILNQDSFTLNSSVKNLIIGLGLNTDTYSLIIYYSALLIFVFFMKMLSAILINWVILTFCSNQNTSIRFRLMRTYLNLPYHRFVGKNSADCINNIQTLAPQFSLNILQAMLRICSEGIMAFLITCFLFYYNPIAFGLLISLLFLTVFLYDFLFRSKVRTYGKLANLSSSKVIKGINEGISGLKEIRVLGKENFFLTTVHDGARTSSDVGKKSAIISSSPRYFIEFILILFITGLVLSTMFLGKDFKALFPVLGVFSIASLRLLPLVNQLTSGIAHIRFGRDTVKKLYNEFKEIQEDGVAAESLSSPTSLKPVDFQKLEMKDVSFQYSESSQNAINGIDLVISKNECVGIIGSSGAGKTTLVDLILCLLEPSSGKILLNGTEVSENIKSFRDNIAYLPQEIFLIDDSLEKNIALGLDEKSIDQQALNEAIQKARLQDFVSSSPEGVKTLVGERGVMLSGGQRQRIALARAFYHQRSFLVMDEATSALDNKTEEEIINEIQSLKGSVTQIVIAHRLSTLKHCDKIFQLENGKIVKSGTYEEVISH